MRFVHCFSDCVPLSDKQRCIVTLSPRLSLSLLLFPFSQPMSVCASRLSSPYSQEKQSTALQRPTELTYDRYQEVYN